MSKMNPVNVGSPERLKAGIKEVPCNVNAVALLRVTSLAKDYLKEHPEYAEQFQDDVEACEAAGDLYNLVWETVNEGINDG